jgi:hypothetical protein
LDLSPGGPILQVVTPRGKTGGAVQVKGQEAPRPGDCFLLPGADDATADPKPADPKLPVPKPVVPGQVIAALSDKVQHKFAQIVEFRHCPRRYASARLP